jgi:hypothetical protein
MWPYVQLEHASALLDKLAEGAALGTLPKYIVWTWLWWGDEWISFAQVPRAMRTWANAERNAPVKNIRASAKNMVRAVAHPKAIGTRKLIRSLVEFAPNGDVETLRDAVDDVLDPQRTGRRRGPDGASLDTDLYLTMIAARQRAVAKLGSYSEDEFGAARRFYRQTRAEYLHEQPRYASDRDLGSLHRVPNPSDIADSACVDLLTCLAALFERKPGGIR